MKKLIYKQSINASAEKVYKTMLGLEQIGTYEEWTAAFNPTSSYEGNWEKGSKMMFVGVDESGQKGGMISRIAELEPAQFVSIQHYGMLKDGKEITTGPEVEQWANSFENYRFSETNGTTTVQVELDMVADYESYMNETYPQALLKLKALCEN